MGWVRRRLPNPCSARKGRTKTERVSPCASLSRPKPFRRRLLRLAPRIPRCSSDRDALFQEVVGETNATGYKEGHQPRAIKAEVASFIALLNSLLTMPGVYDVADARGTDPVE